VQSFQCSWIYGTEGSAGVTGGWQAVPTGMRGHCLRAHGVRSNNAAPSARRRAQLLMARPGGPTGGLKSGNCHECVGHHRQLPGSSVSRQRWQLDARGGKPKNEARRRRSRAPQTRAKRFWDFIRACRADNSGALGRTLRTTRVAFRWVRRVLQRVSKRAVNTFFL
jgi:hypothetical protein